MKTTFTIVVFIFVVIIGVVVVSTVLSSVLNISLLKGPEVSQGILRSDNGGDTWEVKGILKEGKKKNLARIAVVDLVFEPSQSSTLYLLTERDGFYRSEDSGETWSALIGEESGLNPDASVLDIAIEESNRDTFYVSVSQGPRGQVFRSENKGANFEEVYGAALEGELVNAVAIDRYDPRTIFVGTSSGLLLESVNRGESWRTMKEFDGGVLDIVINPRDTRHLYVVHAGGKVSKTVDKGNTWQDLKLPGIQPGMRRVSFLKRPSASGEFTSFNLDPANPSHLLVVSGAGVFESRDAGDSFEELTTIIPTGVLAIGSFTVDPTRSGTMYIGVEGTVYKSIDGGESWQIKNLPLSANVGLIRIDPANSERIFAVLSK